jgi:hypothetical protein
MSTFLEVALGALSKVLGLFLIATLGMAAVYLIIYTIGYALLH